MQESDFGSVIKVDDDDVFGLTSLLDLCRLQNAPAVQQLRTYLRKLSGVSKVSASVTGTSQESTGATDSVALWRAALDENARTALLFNARIR